ncbi:MAG: prephenate dehydrogenase [Nocardioidaceae bacterium]|nr:MAG: prephenate dehydrogenase [Nocardioidaceae bacterium]
MTQLVESELPEPVLVVGAGLLGTSIGLALSEHGIDVLLADQASEHVRTASGLGAGRPVAAGDTPGLVVVAVPPDAVAEAVVGSLSTGAIVTDVSSVKSAPLTEVAGRVPAHDLTRYVGSHPMAGSERSGPLAASARLFDGRPWAITPHIHAAPEAIAAVTTLARYCGATPFTFAPDEHDRAVARTSHLPHLMAVLVAGQMAQARPVDLALSGQGVRDVTRIAAGDPQLWRQIIGANREAVTGLLTEIQADLARLIQALADDDREGLIGLLERGNVGTAAIPGKHGGPITPDTPVYVAVPDHPGELARLLADVGEIGVNIEDLRIDHDPGRPVGLVELRVADSSADHLHAELQQRGWAMHG